MHHPKGWDPLYHLHPPRLTRARPIKPRTVDAMVRDAPAAPARARLARTRTTHSPTPYLTSGERSSQTKSTVHNCHDRRARHHRLHPMPHRPHPQPTDHLQKAREPPRTSTERAVQSINKTRSKKSGARSCHVAAEHPNQLPTPNTAADAAAIASRGQFRLAFGQHLDLPGYLAGAADCPMKAPRPPVPLPAAMSLSMLPLLRPASCSWTHAIVRLTS